MNRLELAEINNLVYTPVIVSVEDETNGEGTDEETDVAKGLNDTVSRSEMSFLHKIIYRWVKRKLDHGIGETDQSHRENTFIAFVVGVTVIEIDKDKMCKEQKCETRNHDIALLAFFVCDQTKRNAEKNEEQKVGSHVDLLRSGPRKIKFGMEHLDGIVDKGLDTCLLKHGQGTNKPKVIFEHFDDHPKAFFLIACVFSLEDFLNAE